MAKRGNGEGSIYKSGNIWRGAVTLGRDFNGKLKRKVFSGKTKSEVISKMKEYRANEAFGLVVINDKITLQEWIYIWIKEYKLNEVRLSTIERYYSLYNNHIKDTNIGKIKLKDLKVTNLQMYYNDILKNKNVSPSTIKYVNKILKSALDQAEKERYILSNPCKYVILPKVEERKEVPVFSLEEQTIFLNSLENNRLKLLYKLALGTGLRMGELLALRWSDIDIKVGLVSVSKTLKRVRKFETTDSIKSFISEGKPKTKTSFRTVPIPSKLLKDIKEHKKFQLEEKLKAGELYEDNDFMFATKLGNSIEPRNLVRNYTKSLEKANIEYRKFHALRHTYATRLFENGVQIKIIQVLLGHSSMKITSDTYTHVLPDEKNNAVEVLNGCI
ncbi:TPA: site-specific integrase [Clostridioides difficile]|uniref:tyrosine-type recombinase/integrase n=1 Tax=Clostridioides difficile TaxID=1496 RepID=UPI00038D97DA|nr:tyrosine-type recombinase/integrase [Clostridioides difficile]EGT4249726.1 site-specific integrase [Clostridioides difficile]EGT5405260.1 site-specific integrase [Clostridioides difficile]EGT5477982.1 site-specific integrase [Clostridioides difficile]EGT5510696.1 site-specific integrase [Clostridioides difficile]EGT5540551.1 site-specific integrase [Clostridioides difficile]